MSVVDDENDRLPEFLMRTICSSKNRQMLMLRDTITNDITEIQISIYEYGTNIISIINNNSGSNKPVLCQQAMFTYTINPCTNLCFLYEYIKQEYEKINIAKKVVDIYYDSYSIKNVMIPIGLCWTKERSFMIILSKNKTNVHCSVI